MKTATATRLGVAALIPTRLRPGVGPPDGYHLHDYLDQHGRATRRRALTPDSLWDALLSHAQDPEDRFRLARNAYHRLRYRHADPLYRTAAATGSTRTAARMTDVLIAHGREEEVRDLLDREAVSLDTHGADEVLRRPWLPRRRTFLELMQRHSRWARLLLTDELVRLGSGPRCDRAGSSFFWRSQCPGQHRPVWWRGAETGRGIGGSGVPAVVRCALMRGT